VNELLFPGLFELAERLVPHLARLRLALRRLLEPPCDIEVRARDGTLITGLLVVDRGRVIAMLGVRTYGPPSPHAYASPYTRPPDYRQGYYSDDDGEPVPSWAR